MIPVEECFEKDRWIFIDPFSTESHWKYMFQSNFSVLFFSFLFIPSFFLQLCLHLCILIPENADVGHQGIRWHGPVVFAHVSSPRSCKEVNRRSNIDRYLSLIQIWHRDDSLSNVHESIHVFCSFSLASCLLPLTCENSFDTSSSRKDWIREWLEQFLENYLRIDRFRETAGQHGSLVQGYSSKLGHQLGHQPCRGSPTEWDGSLARWIEWRHLIPIRNNGTNHDYS